MAGGTLSLRRVRKSGLGLVAAALLMVTSPPALAAPSLEYAIKAAYLSKFGLFVNWPSSRFSSPTSSLVVCVAGHNPFGKLLDEAVRGERIANRPIEVRYLKVVTSQSGCDILYASGPDPQAVAEALSAVSGTPVLTVVDAAIANGTPSIIQFVMEKNHVRFSINERAAAHNGIDISSHLLSIALGVNSSGE